MCLGVRYHYDTVTMAISTKWEFEYYVTILYNHGRQLEPTVLLGLESIAT